MERITLSSINTGAVTQEEIPSCLSAYYRAVDGQMREGLDNPDGPCEGAVAHRAVLSPRSGRRMHGFIVNTIQSSGTATSGLKAVSDPLRASSASSVTFALPSPG
jgi:hypothetical protein